MCPATTLRVGHTRQARPASQPSPASLHIGLALRVQGRVACQLDTDMCTGKETAEREIERLRGERDVWRKRFEATANREKLVVEAQVELTRLRTENEELRLSIASVAQLVGVHSGPEKTMLGSIEGKFTELLIQLGKRYRENEKLRKALEWLLVNLPHCRKCLLDNRLLSERACSFCDAKSRAAELLSRRP